MQRALRAMRSSPSRGGTGSSTSHRMRRPPRPISITVPASSVQMVILLDHRPQREDLGSSRPRPTGRAPEGGQAPWPLRAGMSLS